MRSLTVMLGLALGAAPIAASAQVAETRVPTSPRPQQSTTLDQSASSLPPGAAAADKRLPGTDIGKVRVERKRTHHRAATGTSQAQ